MRIRRTGLLLLLAALVAGIIAFLPSKVAEGFANRALAPAARLQTTGTIWNGQGELQFTRGAGTLSIPLTWRFEPAWLLRLRLGWRLESSSPVANGHTSLGLGLASLAMRDTELATDAVLWHRLSPASMLLGAGGTYTLLILGDESVVVRRGDQPLIDGTAQLTAGNFALATFAPQPLGNYNLKLNAKDGNVSFAFLPAQGALQFDGSGSLALVTPRSFSFKGTASMSADLPPTVANAIKSAGVAQSDGRVLFDVKRNW
jgi:hypothetical protein